MPRMPHHEMTRPPPTVGMVIGRPRREPTCRALQRASVLYDITPHDSHHYDRGAHSQRAIDTCASRAASASGSSHLRPMRTKAARIRHERPRPTGVGVRIVWVMSYSTLARWRARHVGSRRGRPMTCPRSAVASSSRGAAMRGIVTLAAALALSRRPPVHRFPLSRSDHPVRLLCRADTLVVQGMTLRPSLNGSG